MGEKLKKQFITVVPKELKQYNHDINFYELLSNMINSFSLYFNRPPPSETHVQPSSTCSSIASRFDLAVQMRDATYWGAICRDLVRSLYFPYYLAIVHLSIFGSAPRRVASLVSEYRGLVL